MLSGSAIRTLVRLPVRSCGVGDSLHCRTRRRRPCARATSNDQRLTKQREHEGEATLRCAGGHRAKRPRIMRSTHDCGSVENRSPSQTAGGGGGCDERHNLSLPPARCRERECRRRACKASGLGLGDLGAQQGSQSWTCPAAKRPPPGGGSSASSPTARCFVRWTSSCAPSIPTSVTLDMLTSWV
jgi:hypothetical protein